MILNILVIEARIKKIALTN